MDGDLATGTNTANLTRTLAAQAVAVSYDALPEPVRALARQCVLDYYGVALAGADDPLVAILIDEVSDAGGAAQAGVIGHKARLPVLAAALVNGAIGHALDYDDVNLAMPGHPSVAILPGLLALA
jgi:2-methylcitrate dehydratase PrpD